MKTIIAIAVLAVIATTVTHSSVVRVDTRANLNVGSIGPGDRLLNRTTIGRRAVANSVQYEDWVFRGNASTRISALRVQEIGVTQFANPAIRSGGVGQRNVAIRFTSARGRGYNYTISVWGR